VDVPEYGVLTLPENGRGGVRFDKIYTGAAPVEGEKREKREVKEGKEPGSLASGRQVG